MCWPISWKKESLCLQCSCLHLKYHVGPMQHFIWNVCLHTKPRGKRNRKNFSVRSRAFWTLSYKRNKLRRRTFQKLALQYKCPLTDCRTGFLVLMLNLCGHHVSEAVKLLNDVYIKHMSLHDDICDVRLGTYTLWYHLFSIILFCNPIKLVKKLSSMYVRHMSFTMTVYRCILLYVYIM